MNGAKENSMLLGLSTLMFTNWQLSMLYNKTA